MGKLEIVNIGVEGVRYIMSCSDLKRRYVEFRFNGDFRKCYLDNKDIISKTKLMMELMRRYSRDIIKNLEFETYHNNEKLERNKFLIEYEMDRILLQFLKFDIENNYLVWLKMGDVKYMGWCQIGKSGVDKDKLKWIQKEELNSSIGDGETLDKFYRKGLVDNKEYIGWIPGYSWYESKVESGDVKIMSNWGDDNKKDYFNFYPLIDSVMYDNQIMSLKNGNYNGYQFKFFSSDMKFNDWYLVGE
tara:strand:- start:1163 stop:1897 length:735 start_codon:yes stop_codon:yes gene_type:complete